MATILSREERRKRIFSAGSLESALDLPEGEELLTLESHDSDPLVTPEQLELFKYLQLEKQKAPKLKLFSNKDVLIVPGFMGSSLRDTKGSNGLIWIDPLLFFGQGGQQLSRLRLKPFDPDLPVGDADPTVRVQSLGTIPAIYDVLRASLSIPFEVDFFPFDWRLDIENSAQKLADRIRGRLGQSPRELHLIAHSQGSLVARLALQILGPEMARKLVKSLVLLGPATFGTYSAAFAIAGTNESIGLLQSLGVKIPGDLQQVLSSFTGLYQMIPWKAGSVHPEFDPKQLEDAPFWKGKVDSERLENKFAWSGTVDTEFFNDRTSIILGDLPTCGGVMFDGAKMLPDPTKSVRGDGTVPDLCALLPGVRSFRAAGGEHMKLPMNLSVIRAVGALLRGGTPVVRSDGTLGVAASGEAKALEKMGLTPPRVLEEPKPPTVPKKPFKVAARPESKEKEEIAKPGTAGPDYPTPTHRMLRIFSFDPLLGTDLDTLDVAEITIPVPWEIPDVGPVGEYLEVIDRDPSSDRFYHPVNLTDPRLVAQNGLAPAESDPRFHQQMCYAVAMKTIETFEVALGRKPLWAPHYGRDESGHVVFGTADDQYVGRLRVYPHALREANAYYDPDKHALLFGYFPSSEQPGGKTLPGGTVFSCLSYDIIAHETTHAILHGLHRHYLESSNPDVHALHEAFADIVALFQHFSHSEVLKSQIAKSRGDLNRADLLGKMAQQFGQAIAGHRGALRDYIDKKPDATLYRSVVEPHDRGAILVAAVFRAFLNIYESRVRDLFRIANEGKFQEREGSIHPDLVNRLADEAAKSARHILTMCIRALDYLPPVDPTFGEYLRALITADYDLVRDDDRHYRVAVIAAFRDWGIYPTDVNVLDQTALRWRPPSKDHSEHKGTMESLRTILKTLPFRDWNRRSDRRQVFHDANENAVHFRKAIFKNAIEKNDDGKSLGLVVLGEELKSIPRNDRGQPKFEVHSLRPCRRIGPDGQSQVDLVAEIVQRRAGYFDEAIQKDVDSGKLKLTVSEDDYAKAIAANKKASVARPPDFWFRGGCTLIIDAGSGEIRYCIRKSVRNEERLKRQREFENHHTLTSLAAMYYGPDHRSAFAMLHSEH